MQQLENTTLRSLLVQREPLLVAGVVFLAHVALRAAGRILIGAFNDDGAYVALGKALAGGIGYRLIYRVGDGAAARLPHGRCPARSGAAIACGGPRTRPRADCAVPHGGSGGARRGARGARARAASVARRGRVRRRRPRAARRVACRARGRDRAGAALAAARRNPVLALAAARGAARGEHATARRHERVGHVAPPRVRGARRRRADGGGAASGAAARG